MHNVSRSSSNINRTLLRRCLANLDNPAALGATPLAALSLIDARLGVECRPDASHERGRELQRVLRELLSSLKPQNSIERASDPLWRPYLSLHMQYVQGRHHDFVAQHLKVSTAAFYRIVGEAVDVMIERLLQLDQQPAPAQNVPPPVTRSYAHVLPLPSTRTLIGRERELSILVERVRTVEPETLRTFGVYGLAGVGKTELLKQLVHDGEVNSAFDIVLWAGLGRTPDLMALLNSWARMLGVSDQLAGAATSITALARVLHGHVASRRILIVLDDVWSSCAALPLRVGGPGSAMVFSTRLPEVAVALAGKHTLHVHELSRMNAMALLHDFAPDVLHAYPEQFNQLADALGGLPLALVLAGQYLQEAVYIGQARRVEQALSRLQQTLFRQTLQDRSVIADGVDPSERTLAAVVTQTLSVLSDAARRALPAIATLLPKPHTFSEEALLSVAGTSTDVCDELVNYGIIEVASANRYAMHQMIADYLRDHETQPCHWEAMIRHYIAVAECDAQTFCHLKADEANLLEACARAQRHNHPDMLARLTLALLPYLESKSMWQTALPYLEFAIDSAQAHATPALLRDLWAGASRCRLLQGDAVAAIALSDQIIALCQHPKDDVALCHAHDLKARAAMTRGDFAGAVAYGRSALFVATRLNTPELLACVQLTLAAAQAGTGDHVASERLIEQLVISSCDPKLTREIDIRLCQAQARLALAQYLDGKLDRALRSATRAQDVAARAALENQQVTCGVLGALICYVNGDFEQAGQLAEQALLPDPKCRHARSDRSMAHTLLGMIALATTGARDQAGAAFARAIECISETAGSLAFFPASVVLSLIAQMHSALGDNTAAGVLLDRALALAIQPSDLLAICTRSAMVAARTGRVSEAFALLDRATIVLGQCGLTALAESPLPRRELAQARGECWLAAGDLRNAHSAFVEAHGCARRHGGLPGIASTAFQLAEVSMRCGLTSDAAAHARLAYDILSRINHVQAERARALLAFLEVRAPENQTKA